LLRFARNDVENAPLRIYRPDYLPSCLPEKLVNAFAILDPAIEPRSWAVTPFQN
jgi:hypothetical protein